jgi:hypothetical protein
MDSSTFLFVYLLGGFTFIPLLLLTLIIHAYLTFPVRDVKGKQLERDEGIETELDGTGLEDDDAAGYFAVCREYVPGGVNGKPPERTTPVGSTTIASPSPSVYQTMYRSIFDRKGKARGSNVFYVVLRLVIYISFSNPPHLHRLILPILVSTLHRLILPILVSTSPSSLHLHRLILPIYTSSLILQTFTPPPL